MIEFETLEVKSDDGKVMVELEWIGEGIDGDYFPDDPNDTPLLRFTIYRLCDYGTDQVIPDVVTDLCEADAYEYGDWMQVIDGSYCTQLDARAPREQLIEAAKFILGYVESGCRDYSREKRLYEQLSWIGLKDGQPECEIGTWVN